MGRRAPSVGMCPLRYARGDKLAVHLSQGPSAVIAIMDGAAKISAVRSKLRDE